MQQQQLDEKEGLYLTPPDSLNSNPELKWLEIEYGQMVKSFWMAMQVMARGETIILGGLFPGQSGSVRREVDQK